MAQQPQAQPRQPVPQQMKPQMEQSNQQLQPSQGHGARYGEHVIRFYIDWLNLNTILCTKLTLYVIVMASIAQDSRVLRRMHIWVARSHCWLWLAWWRIAKLGLEYVDLV